MELRWVRVSGFKRFHKESLLDVSGQLVAIVGPNEAGKSSILKVLSYLGSNQPIEDIEKTRGSNEEARMSAGYFLNKEDLAAAKLKLPSWLTVVKGQNGKRSFEITPTPPDRDISHRELIATRIRRVTASEKLKEVLEAADSTLVDQLDQLADFLLDGDVDLGAPQLKLISSCKTRLGEHLIGDLPKYALALSEQLAVLHGVESAPNPNNFATSSLVSRLPRFLEFSDEQRSLAAEYNLAETAANPPDPLRNLAKISGLNLTKLSQAVQKGDWAEKHNILEPANKRLYEEFKQTWSQSGVHVHFSSEGDLLKILIVDKNERFSTLGERSDGLRQFVALQAFTTVARVEKPILLIDEADLHLHYDGQADLIQMLAKQEVTQKVVYSTHSVGCLPEDLGVGVRLVSLNADENTSRIRNKFWQSDVPGFSPLLYGMGATSLAFFPTRYALVSEGPTEMLLLPTLLRQAAGRKTLGFQVVPGLSESNLHTIPELENVGSRVAYFVDSDGGGDDLRKQLLKLGVGADRILSVERPEGTVYTIEDFVERTHFVNSVNSLLSKHYEKPVDIDDASFTSPNRIGKVDAACHAAGVGKLSKISIAYELLEIVARDPSAQLLDKKFRSSLRKVYKSIVGALDIPS